MKLFCPRKQIGFYLFIGFVCLNQLPFPGLIEIEKEIYAQKNTINIPTKFEYKISWYHDLLRHQHWCYTATNYILK